MFYFAVAVSSQRDYEGGDQTAEEFLKYGSIQMRYVITDGE